MYLEFNTAFSTFPAPELDLEELNFIMGDLDEVNAASPIFGEVLQKYEKVLGKLTLQGKINLGDNYIKDYYTIQGEWKGEDARELWVRKVN